VLDLLRSGLHPTPRLFFPPPDGSTEADPIARTDGLALSRATYGMIVYTERGCRWLARAFSCLHRNAARRYGI
jgi:hypothetical protein